nr:reverse transcriptase domain-containing protein [Tanacetum cinerariifolium]
MKFDRTYDHQFSRPTGTLPSNTQTNPKPSTSNDKPYRPPPARNEHVNAVFTRSGKSYDPPVNPNAKPAIFLDDSEDEADEVEKEAEPLPKKPTHADPPPLDANMLGPSGELDGTSTLPDGRDTTKTVETNLVSPQIEYAPIAHHPSELSSPKTRLVVSVFQKGDDPIDAINHMMSFLTSVVTSRMSIRSANHTYQHPMGDAEYMLVQVGKFVFPVNFVILRMEEDDRVLLILGRPFLHTTNAIIRFKNKELNLGIGEDRATFLIDKVMQHSHLNDDTCFCMDVIDELNEDEYNTLCF